MKHSPTENFIEPLIEEPLEYSLTKNMYLWHIMQRSCRNPRENHWIINELIYSSAGHTGWYSWNFIFHKLVVFSTTHVHIMCHSDSYWNVRIVLIWVLDTQILLIWKQFKTLIGGLEHLLFFHIMGISSSQLTFIFFRWVGIPPTRSSISIMISRKKHGLGKHSAI